MLPSKSITRTDSTTSNVAPPIAPAFIRNAPPTLPGMPSRNSTPLKLFRFASTETFFNFAPAPQCNLLADNFNFAEMRLRQANHHAAKSAVAHEQIRAATENEKRHFVFAAKFHDAGQIFFVRRLDINIRRPADAQRRVLRQRLVAPNHRRARNAAGDFIGDIFFNSHRIFQNVGGRRHFQWACFA